MYNNTELLSFGEAHSRREINQLCHTVVDICALDPEGRVLIAGSISDRLQVGIPLYDAIAKAHDVDIFVARDKFPDRAPYDAIFNDLLERNLDFLTNFYNADGWWERTHTVSTEFGAVHVIHIEDLAKSNVDTIQYFWAEWVEDQHRHYKDPTKMMKGMDRLLRQIPHISLFRQEAIESVRLGIDMLQHMDLYKSMAKKYIERASKILS